MMDKVMLKLRTFAVVLVIGLALAAACSAAEMMGRQSAQIESTANIN